MLRQADRLIAQVATLMRSFASHADGPAAAVPYLAEADRSLIAKWNKTERPYDIETCLHHQFEQQVARTPEATALRLDGGNGHLPAAQRSGQPGRPFGCGRSVSGPTRVWVYAPIGPTP